VKIRVLHDAGPHAKAQWKLTPGPRKHFGRVGQNKIETTFDLLARQEGKTLFFLKLNIFLLIHMVSIQI
jgi:hypothetical protein